jgi:hypothetical protein
MATIARALLPSFSLLVPTLAFAQAPRTFSELANTIVEILDVATFTLIILGLVIYFWGIAVNIPHFGDEEGAEKRKGFFVWGIVILFVMVSIWGIIQLLQNTLFGGSGPASGTYQSGVTTSCDAFGNCDVE